MFMKFYELININISADGLPVTFFLASGGLYECINRDWLIHLIGIGSKKVLIDMKKSEKNSILFLLDMTKWGNKFNFFPISSCQGEFFEAMPIK